jgi:hypothetical protein
LNVLVKSLIGLLFGFLSAGFPAYLCRYAMAFRCVGSYPDRRLTIETGIRGLQMSVQVDFAQWGTIYLAPGAEANE